MSAEQDEVIGGPLADVGFDADSRWWWEERARGKFRLPRCQANGHVYFPPAPYCPECGEPGFESIDALPTGRIYSWVTVHIAFDAAFSDLVPYTLVAVDLDDGPRMIGHLSGGQPDVGIAVELTTWQADDRFAINFQVITDRQTNETGMVP
jgi:uncharacterized OB-fold protein